MSLRRRVYESCRNDGDVEVIFRVLLVVFRVVIKGDIDGGGSFDRWFLFRE